MWDDDDETLLFEKDTWIDGASSATSELVPSSVFNEDLEGQHVDISFVISLTLRCSNSSTLSV